MSAPAGSSCVKAQRAAVMAAVSSSSSGGHAARSTSSPSWSSSTTRRPPEAGIDLAGRRLGDVVEGRQGRELARELVEPTRRAHALHAEPRLLAHPACKRGGHDGNDQEDEKRQQLVRLGDGEGVERLDEEEVEGEEGQHGGVDRRPYPEQDGGEQDCQQEEHRQVRDRRQAW